MSATTSERNRNSVARIWSRQRPSRVAESALIGDGHHVHRHRHDRPHPPLNQRMSTAADQRPPAPTSRRINLRKMSLQRSLAFYNRLRSPLRGLASGFGYLFESNFSMSRHLRPNFHLTMPGSWFGFPNDGFELAEDLQDSRIFSGRHHWDRAQLHFQQYLGLRHRHQHCPRSFSLKLDPSTINLKIINEMFYGLGLTEVLRLAFNEVLHLH
ncbi:uncharacterized protein LOC108027105 [Drosophila biarmipes]|uniref:uncharacterized protein LOC108027105 n=1 Tax=Drosophila biarmipes TaxID=125945 RepID=UPI0007E62D03|nr:uncharacterized protein LOC108027105 [Drosophila biarmipes]